MGGGGLATLQKMVDREVFMRGSVVRGLESRVKCVGECVNAGH